MRAALVVAALQTRASASRAAVSASFFKTAPGQYGAGDVFLGVTVPEQRRIAREFLHLASGEVVKLLKSPVHEQRLTALLILVAQYQHGSPQVRERIVALYLRHRGRVNNWDLVDSSAPYILGASLVAARDRTVLDRFARSKSLWDRRIAIVATHALIRRGQYRDTLRLAAILLNDDHDLIHKAVGWMLREVGKRDEAVLRRFLAVHAHAMPRTMLRYAVERFSPADRRRYLRR